jgi:uncharacterized membrane protein
MSRADDLQLDLLLVALASLLSLAMAVLQLPVPMRLPVGLVAVLILPGYSVSMALFPPGELDAVERSALAFSLSLGVIVFAAPFLNLAPGGLTAGAIAAALSGITLVATGIAAWRRRGRSDVGHLPVIALSDQALWHRLGRRWVGAGIGLGSVLLVALFALGLFAPPRLATEFFLLGPGGTTDSLPGRVVSGTSMTITVGIANDDGSGQPYRIIVQSGSARLAATGPISVGSSKGWTGTLDFRVPEPGADQEIRILLFKGSAAQPYRSLRLEVDAVAPA